MKYTIFFLSLSLFFSCNSNDSASTNLSEDFTTESNKEITGYLGQNNLCGTQNLANQLRTQELKERINLSFNFEVDELKQKLKSLPAEFQKINIVKTQFNQAEQNLILEKEKTVKVDLNNSLEFSYQDKIVNNNPYQIPFEHSLKIDKEGNVILYLTIYKEDEIRVRRYFSS